MVSPDLLCPLLEQCQMHCLDFAGWLNRNEHCFVWFWLLSDNRTLFRLLDLALSELIFCATHVHPTHGY